MLTTTFERGYRCIAALALLICYSSTLHGMANQWWYDEDMGHGFAVPFVVAWVILRERNRWSALLDEPSKWGWGALLAGAGLHFVSMLGAGLFAGSLALLLSCIGLVVCFGGFALLKAWRFPLLLSVFMLPKLAVVYNQATLPLQLLATRLAEFLLLTAGAVVVRSGNILDVGGNKISVAEACSGVRYLLPLMFLALVIGYLGGARTWLRLALAGAAVPLAIFANAVRVAGSAWAPALAEGTPHAVFGWLIFVVCLGVLGAICHFAAGIGANHAD